MRDDVPTSDGSVALPAAPPAAGEAAAILERLIRPLERQLRALGNARELGSTAGRTALAAIVAGVAVVIAFSTGGDSILVPRSSAAFPGWEAGPLHALLGQPSLGRHTMTLAYSGLLGLMVVAYLVVIRSARSLSMRVIAGALVACSVLLLLGPPLQLNDVFNYLGYARLGALHGLNPYTHVMHAESLDPVYRFSSWENLSSPYGPLFTALSYPLAWLPLPVAYWILKVTTIAAALGFLACVAWCARLLGRDPRPALLFIGANPVFLFFELGGFHNDMFMLLPSTAAIALLLARRDRAAGALLMVAVALKMTTIVLLPFMLIAARPPERRLRVLTGAVVTAVPLIVMSGLMFGTAMPNVADQSGITTAYSFPNLLGLLLGLGGQTTTLVRFLNVVVVVVVLLGLRRRDWLAGAGWGTLALVASLAWLMPWYVVWVLPLAALSSSRALRRVTLGVTVFLVVTFAPETGQFLSAHGINPMDTPAGQAAYAYQQHLQR